MIRWLSVLILLAANGVLWSIPLPQGLTVSFLNIGQGDSILIQGPTGAKLLVDGGPDPSVLREVGSVLPFWDREIDAVLATHPDQDHIGGLPDILKRYKAQYVFEPGIQNTTRAWNSFVNATNEEMKFGAKHVVLHSGARLLLGGGAYADILYPDHDVSKIKETNAGSIVLRVVYGKTSFMLTGDMASIIEDELVREVSIENLASDVLKVGHHGSKYSTDELWLQAVSPSVAIISAGKGNTYGHPAPEVLGRIEKQGARMLSTMDQGTITLVSDGVKVVEK